jgi:hypothetical protein
VVRGNYARNYAKLLAAPQTFHRPAFAPGCARTRREASRLPGIVRRLKRDPESNSLPLDGIS